MNFTRVNAQSKTMRFMDNKLFSVTQIHIYYVQ